jgi:hypothetical protein
MEQKNYTSPVLEVLRLSSEDIVTTSFALDNEGFFDAENWLKLL